jgi:2-polyprenyl-6-methoxyphenol hydroxylase-like FAD-dependent oxidoreductase
MSHRIAVIGAGPGGLTCARVLQRHGVEVTVHDRDAAPDARDQGGTLDLHADSGQIALERAGLLDDFRALSRPEGQSKRFLDRDGTVRVEHTADPGVQAAPEIDRGQLRALLAGSLAPGTVHWGQRLTGAHPLGGGRHRLEFDGGRAAEVDLVIGADGAWSRVRPLVSAARPEYTGVTFVEARFSDVDARHPVLAGLVGDGHAFATHDNRGLIAQRNSGRHVRAYIAFRGPERWYEEAGVDLADTAAVRAALLERFAGWDAGLLKMITDNDGPYLNRPLHVLAAPHTWAHVPGVTLLGDAAHLMSPFGGHGANLAMLDGAELALAVARSSTPDSGVAAYEEVMLERGGVLAAGANAALDRVFSPGERDLATVPDFAAEAPRYERDAAGYRDPAAAR